MHIHIPVSLLIALFAVPFAVWLAWLRSDKIVYSGTALSGLQSGFIATATDTPMLSFLTPENREFFFSDFPAERLRELKASNTTLLETQIVVKKRWLGETFVESVTWGDGSEDVMTRRFDGVLLAAFYLVLGVAAIVFSIWASAAALIISGFLTGLLVPAAPLDQKHKGQMLSLRLMAALCLFCTAVTFAHPSIFTLFPGSVAAFAFGQICGMLSRDSK